MKKGLDKSPSMWMYDTLRLLNNFHFFAARWQLEVKLLHPLGLVQYTTTNSAVTTRTNALVIF